MRAEMHLREAGVDLVKDGRDADACNPGLARMSLRRHRRDTPLALDEVHKAGLTRTDPHTASLPQRKITTLFERPSDSDDVVAPVYLVLATTLDRAIKMPKLYPFEEGTDRDLVRKTERPRGRH
jgi:hypothetical protein